MDLDREATDTGQVFVAGAGFGVLATESVLLHLCEGQGRAGAHTPGSLFGPTLAAAIGGEFLVDQSREFSERG